MTKSTTRQTLAMFGLDPKTKPFSITPNGVMRLYVGEDTKTDTVKLVIIAKNIEAPQCIFLGSLLAAKLSAEILTASNSINFRQIKAKEKAKKKAKKASQA